MGVLRGLPAVWLLASALAASCSADDTGGNPPAGGAGGSSGGTSATGGSGANGGSSGSGGASTGGSAGSTSGGSGGSGGTSGTGGSGSGGGGSSGGAGGAKDGGAGAGGTTGTSGSGGSAGGTAGTGGRSGADAGDASIRDGAAGANANDAGARDGDAATSCVKAKLLWSEDFETGDYSRWTSQTYDGNWGNDCQSNGFSTVHALSGTHSHRSEIVCAYTESHRGYGGLQFAGDAVVSKYTNTGVGTDAPYGVINTFHSWLDTPTVFQNGKWFSPWTVNDDCGWADEVMTLGLEDPTNKLAAAHYQAGGGTRVFAPNAPAFPTGRWVRVTVYVNYYDGTMHYWQDGAEVAHVTFVRPKKTICQWHWGMYASADNDNIVLFEDDNSIWKLDEAWTDFKKEPWLGGSVQVCP